MNKQIRSFYVDRYHCHCRSYCHCNVIVIVILICVICLMKLLHLRVYLSFRLPPEMRVFSK